MAIVRVDKTTGNYYMAHKGYLYDERLSFKAKGVMTYISSKSDDYVVNITEISKAAKDGKASVRTAIQELLAYGYLEEN
ncbi:hypothetical protein [Staphylococcus capitis]|uniref:hypothetical protein n=1 Tax=Staphylococcus capitis TaxID=29388 RepID=UPI001BD1229A|nr:hypothetical protein [Staphylococcus capitis]